MNLKFTQSAHFRIETEALCVKSQHRWDVDNRTIHAPITQRMRQH